MRCPTRPSYPGHPTWRRPRRPSSRLTAIAAATAPLSMATRVAAATFLVVSALVAWLTITVPVAARILQILVVASIGYVAWLSWHGARTMRDVLANARSGAAEPTGLAADLPFVSLV